MQRGPHPVTGEQPLESSPGLVVAHDADERDLRTERRRVTRDVPGAARALFVARNLYDRHRRLRRNALDLSKPVAVEHDVAHDEQARTRHGVAIIGKPLATHVLNAPFGLAGPRPAMAGRCRSIPDPRRAPA